MNRGIRLGSIAGIEIVADWSLLIIFLLIMVSLGGGLFPAWHPDWSLPLVWSTALGAAILFFASLLAHELAHALVGRAWGIGMRRITLFMFGGMAHMDNDPPQWRSELVMAAAGPAASLALGLLFLALAALAGGPVTIDPDEPQRHLATLTPLATLLFWLGPVNILLAVFNLAPGFPLDGGRMLRAAIWGATGSFHRATRWASTVGQGFAWLLIAAGAMMALGLQVPLLGSGLVGGLWLVFIGWFLNNAARVSYRQTRIRETLEDLPVARVMQTQVTRVEPGISVEALIEQQMMSSGQRVFPVESGGRFLGMVCLDDLAQCPREQRTQMRAADIMTPAAELVCVSPRQDAAAALRMLAGHGVNQLPVVDGGRLVGLLRREDMIRWLSLHDRRGHAPAGGG